MIKKTYIYNVFLSERLSNSLCRSDVLPFSEFINILSILHYIFIKFIILLWTFLVISFAQYKECIIWRISYSKFSDVLPAFICASASGILWSICLGVNFSKGQAKSEWGNFP